MIRATFLALVLVGASAFAPSATKSVNTVMHGETSYVDVIGADPGPIEPSGFMYERAQHVASLQISDAFETPGLVRSLPGTRRRRASRAAAPSRSSTAALR